MTETKFPWCVACSDWRACALLSAKTEEERQAIMTADEPGSESVDIQDDQPVDPNLVGLENDSDRR